MRPPAYSADDIALIRANYPTKGAPYCAAKLGRTVEAIRLKAHALGVRAADHLQLNVEKQMPSDFRQTFVAIGSVIGTSRHYESSPRTIRRWLKEAGIVVAKPERKHPPRVRNRARTDDGRIKSNPGWKPPLPVHYGLRGGKDIWECARDHLQRTTAVYRCNERGGARIDGKLWRVGMAIVDGDELLRRARGKGFGL